MTFKKYTKTEQLEIKITEAARRFYDEVRKQNLDSATIESFRWDDGYITDAVQLTIESAERRKRPHPYRGSVNIAVLKAGGVKLLDPPIEKPVVPKLKKYLAEVEAVKKLAEAKPRPEPPRPSSRRLNRRASLAFMQALSLAANEVRIDVKDLEPETDAA